MKKTCDAITSKGEKCRLPAGYQTNHKGVGRCKFHDGKDNVENLVNDIKHDLSSVIDRNINLINSYIDKLALGQSNIESNNILRDCINEIAMVEKEDVKITATQTGIQIDTSKDTPRDNALCKKYARIAKAIHKLFKDRVNKILDDYHSKLEKQSITDSLWEPAKTIDDIHIEKLEPKPENHKKTCGIIFLVLTFGFICIASLGLTYRPDTVPLMIIIYIIVIIGFLFLTHKVGYWEFPTDEEGKSIQEARMRKWGGPIKSAHIIRLERGLYTGRGNRRPYPHGRRTKKY